MNDTSDVAFRPAGAGRSRFHPVNADWDLYRYGQWDAKSGRSQRGEVLASVLVERNRIAQGKVGLTSSAQMNSEDVVEGRIEREVADRFAGRVEDALAEGQL